MKKVAILLMLYVTLMGITGCELFPSDTPTTPNVENATQGLEYIGNGDGTCYVNGIGTCTDTDIVIPSTSPDGDIVTSIGEFAFSECSDITSVVIGNSVTSICFRAFSYCSNLTSAVIGDSVTSIDESAFSECPSLTYITIGDGVTSIGDYAFMGCSSLTSFTVDADNEYYKSIDGNLYTKDGKTLIRYAIGKSDKEFSIPDSVTSIDDYAFYGCYSLTCITVDAGNEYYKSIDGNLYTKDGKTLVKYAIGKSDTEFSIPEGVTYIGDFAFYGCSGLSSIAIGNNVTSIGQQAFTWCSNLTSITIGDGVTSIGDYAFMGCSRLSSVAIPDSVTSIGVSAFSYCSGLTSVVIGDGVTYVDDSVFWFCSGLISVVIPDSVTSIGDGAFTWCFGLTDIYYTGSKEEWTTIKIGTNNDYLHKATVHCNYVP